MGLGRRAQKGQGPSGSPSPAKEQNAMGHPTRAHPSQTGVSVKMNYEPDESSETDHTRDGSEG